MEIKQMIYFTTVVEEKTFKAAAAKLHMTQPPLSAQIKILETEVGSPLLIRGPRSVSLTDAGKIFYDRAKNILELTHILEQELKDNTSGNVGTLRIGVVSSASQVLLENYIAPFSKLFPNIHFELTEKNTYTLVDMMKSKLLDVALVRTPFTDSADFNTRTLKKEHVIAVASKDFWVSAGLLSDECSAEDDNSSENYNNITFNNISCDNNTCGDNSSECTYKAQMANHTTEKLQEIDVKTLSSLPLIVYRRWKTFFDVFFTEQNLVPNYFCINDDARTAIMWAGKGLGVAISPQSAYESAAVESSSHLKAFIINPEIFSTMCLITNKSAYHPKALDEFLKFTGTE